MCRLVAWVGPPADASLPLFGGEHSLYRQAWEPRELLHGSVNADGWGVVWYGARGAARLARAEPVWYDPSIRRVLSTIRAPVVVAALRNATPGIPVASSAVPPLLLDRWSFVLNGFIPDFRPRHMRALRSTLPDHLYGQLVGVSDAETLFLLAVARLQEGEGLAEALEGVARSTLDRVDRYGDRRECQLTMLLSDGDDVAAIRASNRDQVNSLYTLDDRGLASGGRLLASEPLDGDEGWTAVPRDVVVTMRRGEVGG